MNLQNQSSETSCEVCLEEAPDPSRDDGLCKDCGEISDKYAINENQLSLIEDQEGEDD